ncbi:MAG: hypothetical protein AVDCRST_MAG85-781, partial [uncultured Solirubrobacteraceae bacterium]
AAAGGPRARRAPAVRARRRVGGGRRHGLVHRRRDGRGARPGVRVRRARRDHVPGGLHRARAVRGVRAAGRRADRDPQDAARARRHLDRHAADHRHRTGPRRSDRQRAGRGHVLAAARRGRHGRRHRAAALDVHRPGHRRRRRPVRHRRAGVPRRGAPQPRDEEARARPAALDRLPRRGRRPAARRVDERRRHRVDDRPVPVGLPAPSDRQRDQPHRRGAAAGPQARRARLPGARFQPALHVDRRGARPLRDPRELRARRDPHRHDPLPRRPPRLRRRGRIALRQRPPVVHGRPRGL